MSRVNRVSSSAALDFSFMSLDSAGTSHPSDRLSFSSLQSANSPRKSISKLARNISAPSRLRQSKARRLSQSDRKSSVEVASKTKRSSLSKKESLPVSKRHKKFDAIQPVRLIKTPDAYETKRKTNIRSEPSSSPNKRPAKKARLPKGEFNKENIELNILNSSKYQRKRKASSSDPLKLSEVVQKETKILKVDSTPNLATFLKSFKSAKSCYSSGNFTKALEIYTNINTSLKSMSPNRDFSVESGARFTSEMIQKISKSNESLCLFLVKDTERCLKLLVSDCVNTKICGLSFGQSNLLAAKIFINRGEMKSAKIFLKPLISLIDPSTTHLRQENNQIQKYFLLDQRDIYKLGNQLQESTLKFNDLLKSAFKYLEKEKPEKAFVLSSALEKIAPSCSQAWLLKIAANFLQIAKFKSTSESFQRSPKDETKDTKSVEEVELKSRVAALKDELKEIVASQLRNSTNVTWIDANRRESLLESLYNYGALFLRLSFLNESLLFFKLVCKSKSRGFEDLKMKAKEEASKVDKMDSLLALGIRNHSNKNYTQAVFYFTKALEIDPNNNLFNGRVLFRRSNSLLHLDSIVSIEKALEDCNKCLELIPDYIKANRRKAECYAKSHQFSKAIYEMETVYKTTRDQQDMYNLRKLKIQLQKQQFKNQQETQKKKRESQRKRNHHHHPHSQQNHQSTPRSSRHRYNTRSSAKKKAKEGKRYNLRTRESEKTLYDVLGVERDASTLAVKRAFKKLALALHPDKQKKVGDIKEKEERFKKVSEAYSVLSSPSKRREYDRKHLC